MEGIARSKKMTGPNSWQERKISELKAKIAAEQAIINGQR